MPTFLLVEDSPIIVKIIKHVCKTHPHLTMDIATTFAEAKALLKQNGKDNYLTAVVDLNLPDAPNGEVVEHTLSLSIPTIVLTGNFDDTIREQMSNKNIVDYVVKESRFSYEYVIRLINRLHKNQDIKVLVTDDSKMSRNYIATQLRNQLFKVITADDGDTALETLNKDPDIKMLITDYNMPRMNGFELVKNIRKEVSKNELVIIGLSGEGDTQLSAKFIKNGANDFLTKPFGREEFLCRIMSNIENMEYVQTMQHMAFHDYVTGLPNKRSFFETGNKLIEQAQQKGVDISLALIGIDQINQLQDQYGFDAIEQVQKNLTELLPKAFGRFSCARVSDSEIAVLMNGLNEEQAFKLTDSFRTLVEDHIVLMEGLSFNFNVSAGVTSAQHQSLIESFKEADNRLYQAKATGGNQICAEE